MNARSQKERQKVEKIRTFLERNRVFFDVLFSFAFAGVIATLGLVIAYQANNLSSLQAQLQQRQLELKEQEVLPYIKAYMEARHVSSNSFDYWIEVANYGGLLESVEVFYDTFVGITGLVELGGDWKHVYIPCDHHTSHYERGSVAGVVFSLSPYTGEPAISTVFAAYEQWANQSEKYRYIDLFCRLTVLYEDRSGKTQSCRFRLGEGFNQRIREVEPFFVSPGVYVDHFGMTGVLDRTTLEEKIGKSRLQLADMTPSLLDDLFREYSVMGRPSSDWRFGYGTKYFDQ